LAVREALVACHGAVVWVPTSLAAVDAELARVVEEEVEVEADIANGAGELVAAVVAH